MAERLTYQSLVQQFLGVFWNVERGLIPTVRDLSLRPGQMLRGYLSGDERGRYMSAIGYLVLMASIYTTLFVLFPPERLFDSMQRDLSDNGAVLDPEQFVAWYRSVLSRYYQVFIYLPVPFMALATRWVFTSLGYNYPEHLVINGFAAGHITLIGNLITQKANQLVRVS